MRQKRGGNTGSHTKVNFHETWCKVPSEDFWFFFPLENIFFLFCDFVPHDYVSLWGLEWIRNIWNVKRELWGLCGLIVTVNNKFFLANMLSRLENRSAPPQWRQPFWELAQFETALWFIFLCFWCDEQRRLPSCSWQTSYSKQPIAPFWSPRPLPQRVHRW